MSIKIRQKYIIFTFFLIAAAAIFIASIKMFQKKPKLPLPKDPELNLPPSTLSNEETGEKQPMADLLIDESQAQHELIDVFKGTGGQRSSSLSSASSFAYPNYSSSPSPRSSGESSRKNSSKLDHSKLNIVKGHGKERTNSGSSNESGSNITENLKSAIGSADNSRPESALSSIGQDNGNSSDFERFATIPQGDFNYSPISCSPDDTSYSIVNDAILFNVLYEAVDQSEEKRAKGENTRNVDRPLSIEEDDMPFESAVSSATPYESADENDISEQNVYVNIKNNNEVQNLTNQGKLDTKPSNSVMQEQETEAVEKKEKLSDQQNTVGIDQGLSVIRTADVDTTTQEKTMDESALGFHENEANADDTKQLETNDVFDEQAHKTGGEDTVQAINADIETKEEINQEEVEAEHSSSITPEETNNSDELPNITTPKLNDASDDMSKKEKMIFEDYRDKEAEYSQSDSDADYESDVDQDEGEIQESKMEQCIAMLSPNKSKSTMRPLTPSKLDGIISKSNFTDALSNLRNVYNTPFITAVNSPNKSAGEDAAQITNADTETKEDNTLSMFTQEETVDQSERFYSLAESDLSFHENEANADDTKQLETNDVFDEQAHKTGSDNIVERTEDELKKLAQALEDISKNKLMDKTKLTEDENTQFQKLLGLSKEKQEKVKGHICDAMKKNLIIKKMNKMLNTAEPDNGKSNEAENKEPTTKLQNPQKPENISSQSCTK